MVFCGRRPRARTARASHPVLEVPIKRTVHKHQRVSIPATVGSIARCIGPYRRCAGNSHLFERWQPQIAICDRELFLPIAARAAGLQCISVDHSHVLPACRYHVPVHSGVSWGAIACFEDALLFNRTRRNLIVSFFHPQLKQPAFDELLPPVLRTETREISPSAGDHIFIYQQEPDLRPIDSRPRRQLPRPVVIYGFKQTASTEGNLIFKPFHPRGILEDLAGCAYAVVNGGHRSHL